MYCGSHYGPVFGGYLNTRLGLVNDLCISDNANTSARSSCLGRTYQLPPGQQNTFFTGAFDFSVTDYEVFGLRQ